MDIAKYIASGILENYCMGLLSREEKLGVLRICALYPEVQKQLERIEIDLERYAQEHAIAPRYDVLDRIMANIEQVEQEKEMSLSNLPLISKYSSHTKWLQVVKELVPDELPAGQNIRIIRNDDKVLQMLVISDTDFEDELHDDLNESFLILQGHCECTFGDHVFRLGPGGFAEVPLHEMHRVDILEQKPVVAILQRVQL